MRWEPVINAGNVISVVVMLGGLIGVYVNIREIQIRQESRLMYVEEQVRVMTELGRTVVKAQSEIENIKLALILNTDNSTKTLEQLTSIKVDIATIKALYQNQVDGYTSGRKSFSPGVR